VTGSFSRTAVNSATGVATPAAGLITGAIVLIAIQFLTPVMKLISKASLGAIIIVSVSSGGGGGGMCVCVCVCVCVGGGGGGG
jgi:MFS superfamily sulfate permease-like transporter